MRYYNKIIDNNRLEYNRTRKSVGVGENSADSVMNDKGYFLVNVVQPLIDTVTQRYSGTSFSFDGVIDTKTYGVVDIPQEELLEGQITKGEQYINSLISTELSAFNKLHGTVFNKINDMGIYIIDDAYYLKTECAGLVTWNNLLWATARANQAAVLEGTMTEDEFRNSLPVYGV